MTWPAPHFILVVSPFQHGYICVCVCVPLRVCVWRCAAPPCCASACECLYVSTQTCHFGLRGWNMNQRSRVDVSTQQSPGASLPTDSPLTTSVWPLEHKHSWFKRWYRHIKRWMNYILHLAFRHVAGNLVPSDICFEFSLSDHRKAGKKKSRRVFRRFALILERSDFVLWWMAAGNKWTVVCLKLIYCLIITCDDDVNEAALRSKFSGFKRLVGKDPPAFCGDVLDYRSIKYKLWQTDVSMRQLICVSEMLFKYPNEAISN